MEQITQFNKLYADISDSLKYSKGILCDLDIDNSEGQKKVSGIVAQLTSIQEHFDSELALLKENSEWEHFVVAFFGETNAGKSTIIESLRILFDEESRQQLIDSNLHDLEKLNSELEMHVHKVKLHFQAVCQRHAQQYTYLESELSDISEIVQRESSSRARKKNIVYLFMGAMLGAFLYSAAWFAFGG